jgi:hypothetical protein
MILCNNQSCIAVAKGATTNFKHSKHIDIRKMYIKEILVKGDIEVVYCKTDGNIADIMTKALPKTRFIKLRDNLLGAVLAVQETVDKWGFYLKDILEDNVEW